MKTYYTPLLKQHGIVIPLVAIAMLALLGMTGLALDMGHLYENKTRLQNVVDAAALSAAKKLDETHGDQAAAMTAAKNTVVDRNVTDAANNGANGEMSAVAKADVLVDFFELATGACGSAGYADCFVRVRVNNLSRPNFLIQVLGLGNTKTVAARAVAGPSPTLTEVCDIAPMTVCGDPTAGPPSYGLTTTSEDPTKVYTLKIGTDTPSPIGPGNFQLIDLQGSQGGSDIRQNMAGGYDKCWDSSGTGNLPIDTAPGNKVGPSAQGLNTRFNQYNGPVNPTDYPPDTVISSPLLYRDYVSHDPDLPSGVTGKPGRRIVAMPIGDCTNVAGPGNTTMPLLALGCFFLTEPAGKGGQQEIYGQFLGTGCPANGTPGANPSTGSGPYVIQLYKDPLSGDS